MFSQILRNPINTIKGCLACQQLPHTVQILQRFSLQSFDITNFKTNIKTNPYQNPNYLCDTGKQIPKQIINPILFMKELLT